MKTISGWRRLMAPGKVQANPDTNLTLARPSCSGSYFLHSCCGLLFFWSRSLIHVNGKNSSSSKVCSPCNLSG